MRVKAKYDGEIIDIVSVEPLPKQGCETNTQNRFGTGPVSVEPLPKQGCERVCSLPLVLCLPCLSGTPAEAGVRVGIKDFEATEDVVSVEPLPKQGCEFGYKNDLEFKD